MQAISPSDWDNHLKQLGGHFLQSSAWGAFQHALGRKVLQSHDQTWAWQGTELSVPGLRYLYLPYGPAVGSQPAEAIASALVAAGEHGLDFLRLEPTGAVTEADLKAHNAIRTVGSQPEHTWVLDLEPNIDSLRSALESGHRNRINGAAKRGITITKTTDLAILEVFQHMLDDTAKRAGIRNHPDSYYRTLAETLVPAGAACFYIAQADGQPVSISLMYDWHDTRYYAHSGAFQELNRKFNTTVALVWQAIIDAKADGKRHFDFWGVAPADQPNHPWAGVSAFKRAFGGRQVDYLGTWDIPLHKTKYAAYKLQRRLRGKGSGRRG